jgi:hypothetical protein
MQNLQKINFTKLTYFFGVVFICSISLWIIMLLVLTPLPSGFVMTLFSMSIIVGVLSSIGTILCSLLYFKFQKNINPSQTGLIIALLILGGAYFLFNLTLFLASVFLEP